MKITMKRLVALLCILVLITNPLHFNAVIGAEETENEEETVSLWDGTSQEITPKDNVYEIESAAQFAWFASQVNSNTNFDGCEVKLCINIDLDNRAWTPVGSNLNHYFAGIFDGQDHVVRNGKYSVSINSANIVNAPYHTVGLFGLCQNATVKNLVVADMALSVENSSGYTQSYSSIDGTNVYAGGICGYAHDTIFHNVRCVNSQIKAYTGTEAGASHAGGICGYAEENCMLTYCISDNNTITGTSDSSSMNSHVGGLIGELMNQGLVCQSYNTSAVYGGHTMAVAYTGGLVGKSDNNTDTLSVIRDCYNQGNVFHTGSWLENGAAGGIIGYCYSSITRCYNSGNVTASTQASYTGNDVYIAGIAGNGSSSGTITNCAVMSSQISGGTSNKIIANAGTKNWNIAVKGISGSLGNDADERFSTQEFKSCFETCRFE